MKAHSEFRTPETVPPPVGEHVRRARERLGWSLAKLAAESGLSVGSLSQIESGQSTSTLGAIARLARALQLPVRALLGPASPGARVQRAASSRGPALGEQRAVEVRAVFHAGPAAPVGVYEVRVAVGAEAWVGGRGIGSVRTLLVGAGAVEVLLGESTQSLVEGDALATAADEPIRCRNAAEVETRLYLVEVGDGG